MTNWIAVVDDDMTTLTVAGRILSNNNMRVSAMNSGKALLSFVKENKPDLILIQTEMPEMDGHRLTKLIKSDDKTSFLPVVIFSSLVNEEMRRKGESLGANAQLSKPEIGNLVTTIDSLVNLNS